LFKKYKGPQQGDEADNTALAKFLSVNETRRRVTYTGTAPTFLPVTTVDWEILGGVKRYLNDFFYPNGSPLLESFGQIAAKGRLGPGANIGAKGTDFYSKLFDSRLSTTTPALYEAYKSHISQFPMWLNAEKFRQEHHGDFDVVKGNKLCFVPKNVDTSRVIAVEPGLNMFFQLGVGEILTNRLKTMFGIDLATQPDANRFYAKIGSTGDASISTIDLSSASDSLSLGFCEAFIPREQLAWLKLFRSPEAVLPNGSSVRLEMLSTMGNGYTFPLQTAIFASVVLAVRQHFGRLQSRRVHVFGDDIIVQGPLDEARQVVRTLGHCGFEVNSQKSFLGGPFLESCGHDYYYGHFVRGVYIKSLSTAQDRYVAINRLNEWTADTGVFLTHLVGCLTSMVKPLFVPVYESDDCGIRVPFSRVTNRRLDGNLSVIYDKWVPRTGGYRVLGTDARLEPATRVSGKKGKRSEGLHKRLFNPDGLLLAFLRGDIRNEKLVVRLHQTSYSKKRGVTPNWDAPHPSWGGTDVSRWPRWETAVNANVG